MKINLYLSLIQKMKEAFKMIPRLQMNRRIPYVGMIQGTAGTLLDDPV